MDRLIVMYNLREGQSQAVFEQWIREVDLPGYAKLTAMRNPAYYRSAGLLGENKPAPYAYTVVIETDGPEAVEAEMGDPKWAGFIADFESRTADATYVIAKRIA